MSVLTFSKVLAGGAWQAAGSVVPSAGEVGMGLNGPVDQSRTEGLKGVVEQVQTLVRHRGHPSYSITAVL